MSKPRKKRSNPRIEVPKKRRTKGQLRRSKAALKGWQTRRINRLADAKQAIKELSDTGERALVVRLNQHIKDLEMVIAEKWVKSEDDHMLHRDGSIALYPSYLRHIPTPVYVQTISTLKKAEKKGPNALKEMAVYIAGLFNVSLADVYTLLYSP